MAHGLFFAIPSLVFFFFCNYRKFVYSLRAHINIRLNMLSCRYHVLISIIKLTTLLILRSANNCIISIQLVFFFSIVNIDQLMNPEVRDVFKIFTNYRTFQFFYFFYCIRLSLSKVFNFLLSRVVQSKCCLQEISRRISSV